MQYQVSTAEQFQRKQHVKAASKQVMKDKGNFFTRLMGLFKKGDK